jgi:hypothetical protein
VPDPPVIKPLPVPDKKIDFEKIFVDKPIYKVEFENATKQNEERFAGFAKTLQNNEKLFERVVTSTIPGKNPIPGVNPAAGLEDVLVGGKDLTGPVRDFRARQKDLDSTPVDAPDRKEKETALVNAAEVLTNELNQPAVKADIGNAIVVKSVLADIHSGTSMVKGEELKTKVADVSNLANNINKGFMLNR